MPPVVRGIGMAQADGPTPPNTKPPCREPSDRPIVVAALTTGILVLATILAPRALATPPRGGAGAALTVPPPMGWNDWAHYQCRVDARVVLANARALVKTGLAARGYKLVVVDDCWMRKHRNREGDLRANRRKFPAGMRALARSVRRLGLKFGIYEDAGSATCGGGAGSGTPPGGGPAHFLADARLFASWGVDYLKLDGCHVFVPPGVSPAAAYRTAYRAASRALAHVARPIIFEESAPAYFQGSPEWYDVLNWVRRYGELWRTGSDIATYDPRDPRRSRWASVMWNYDYNLELGRFQAPGRWDDPDMIIGGDPGLTRAETRSQLALWSMMSAPLILGSDVARLSAASIRILGNRAVLAVDQDPLGRMATLLERSPSEDLLIKPLVNGRYAIALLNRGSRPLRVRVHPERLGFGGAGCRLDAVDLWTGVHHRAARALVARVGVHDTVIWSVRPDRRCGPPARVGVITRIRPHLARNQRTAEMYTRCLTAPGRVANCTGGASQSWRVLADGALRSGGKCLAEIGAAARLQACTASLFERWRYTILGRLVNRATRRCLTGPVNGPLAVERCGHNPASQIWSVPLPLGAP